VKNVFFVGPASVGKSTNGKLLAQKLGFRFVDIDLYFCNEIALIPDYIQKYGYKAYCERNSQLTDELIGRFPKNTVFATPSGFLVHEESPHLVEKHVVLIDKNAISVLLLPSHDPYETVEMVVARQIARWPKVNPVNERERYITRHKKYKLYGKVKIIGQFSPDDTTDLILKEMNLESVT
jgi:shikimate kinase